MTRARWRPILFGALAALGVAVVGGSMTDTGPWYQALAKPELQPPGWAFGPAWTVIFALAVMAFATAWRDAPTRRQRDWIVVLFGLNALLNVGWSALFFTVKRPDWALVEVVVLWLSVLAVIAVVRRYSRPAAFFMAPYLIWVAFAAYLNWEVVRLNGPFA